MPINAHDWLLCAARLAFPTRHEQFHRFSTGGYVVHRITGPFKGRVSAWFDKKGVMLDAEQILPGAADGRPVKRDGPMWRRAQCIGPKVARRMPTPQEVNHAASRT